MVVNRPAVAAPYNVDRNGYTFANSLQEAKVIIAIKSGLLLESSTTGVDIDVHVEQRTVTHYGKVKSYREQDLAMAIAKNTDDVNDVTSELSEGS
ncbi:BON domain-containing protein [Alteromonas ponticola]|uniref:BON domain-containing protein n=1 Tax=Alteromonas ponticola TaxID=2720613 RepID=A0ABX1R5F6_9ALTE|nr:BON domain-containing protein [Alteromonas ponticola]NMH60871.1 BON domain-containing protein [Alteromonas ponticola]